MTAAGNQHSWGSFWQWNPDVFFQIISAWDPNICERGSRVTLVRAEERGTEASPDPSRVLLPSRLSAPILCPSGEGDLSSPLQPGLTRVVFSIPGHVCCGRVPGDRENPVHL